MSQSATMNGAGPTPGPTPDGDDSTAPDAHEGKGLPVETIS